MADDGQPDAHPYRAAALLTGSLVTVALLWSCVAAPILHDFAGPARWWIPGDVWVYVLPAHFIADGAHAFLYEAHPAYVYPPGMALYFAPIAAVGAALDLSESTSIVVHKPEMWLLVAPAGTSLAVVPLVEVRRLLWHMGVRQRLSALQLLVCVVALGPIAVTWGHYEELLVIGLVVRSVRLTAEERWAGAAASVGIALLFKQTALLALPLILVQTPPEHRVRSLLRIVGPVALFTVPCLLLDWAHAAPALLRAASFPDTGRAALWLAGDEAVVASGARVLALVVAGAVACLVPRRARGVDLVAALAVVTLLRVLFEPVVFAYYLGAPVLLAVTASAADGRFPWRALLTGSAMSLVFVPPVEHRRWWAMFCLLAVALGVDPVRRLIRTRSESAIPSR